MAINIHEVGGTNFASQLLSADWQLLPFAKVRFRTMPHPLTRLPHLRKKWKL